MSMIMICGLLIFNLSNIHIGIGIGVCPETAVHGDQSHHGFDSLARVCKLRMGLCYCGTLR